MTEHPKVGDRGPRNWGQSMCETTSAVGFICTRRPDHDGPHAASGLDAIVAVWSADD